MKLPKFSLNLARCEQRHNFINQVLPLVKWTVPAQLKLPDEELVEYHLETCALQYAYFIGWFETYFFEF